MASSTIEKAAALGADTKVVALSNGHISVKIPAGALLEMVEVDSALYKVPSGVNEGLTIAFRETAGGSGGFAMAGNTQDPVSFQKLRWYQRGSLHLIGLIAAAVVFLSVAVTAAVKATLGRFRARSAQYARPSEKWIWRIGVAASTSFVLGPICAFVILAGLGANDTANNVLRAAILVALTFLLFAAALGITTPVLAVFAWRNKYWGIGRRLHFTLLAASMAICLPLLYYYHLVGYWL
jgi:hypothetical protein